MHRTTPCVGICSTTYGDLICRGCKRFAHEIVQWNGYDDDQRDRVWRRLGELRDGSVAQFVTREQLDALVERAEELNLPPGRTTTPQAIAYEVLRRMVLRPLPHADQGWARELLNRIDKEYFQRSRAHYERNFRIPSE